VETAPQPEQQTALGRKGQYIASLWFVAALGPGLLVFSFPKLFGRELIPSFIGIPKFWVAFVLVAWAAGIISGPYRRALRRSHL
jgi:hypothetical protein